MINFLSETKEMLTEINKTPADIIYIGNISNNPNNIYSCTWEEFKNLADFKYNNGFGGHEIPGDLIILFSDNSWFSRGEYDGSEWWEHKQIPKIPTRTKKIKSFKLTDSGVYFDSGSLFD